MFADSLLESAPHPAHRAGWSKLASVLLQSLALTVVLAIPLFHLEHLQFVPPPPSIQMTSVQQPPVVHQTMASTTSIAPPTETVRLTFTTHPTTTRNEEQVGPPNGWQQIGPPCVGNCAPGLNPPGLSNGPFVIPPAPPRPPAHAPRVSEMQLGGLIHKVVPEYPIIAKQLRVEGAVILLATVGKDGRVEHVQAVSGPPLLVRPAIAAVEQWQYRPYLLNQEPVVVQTQITVNFVLNRN